VEASLLSGDNDREASALSPMFKGNMRFNQTPGDKLQYVKSLRDNGHKVLMFGDGLNDAGALQQSNLGIVVAENTNNFTPACDAIVHADEFERLPVFFDLATWGVNTVNRAYLLAGAYNLVGLSYAVSGTLSPVVAAILMPLSSVSIILFGYGMTYWKAWKMGLLES
jgi:Cu+-exporting ATPase